MVTDVNWWCKAAVMEAAVVEKAAEVEAKYDQLGNNDLLSFVQQGFIVDYMIE